MPDPAGRPDPPHERPEDEDIRRHVSRHMVQAMKEYYGKGPEQVRSYFFDDLLLVVMRGGFTTAEETMLEADQDDAVRDFRQRFENEMAERLRGTVEQVTGRRVINYQSQVLFEPNMAIELFVFDDDDGGQAPAP